MSDQNHRFIFDSHGIRGELVELESSIQSMLDKHNYPVAIADLLQQVAAVSIMLTTTLKFEGKMSVQLQTTGNLKLLVVQSTNQLKYRGIARYDEQVNYAGLSFSDLIKDGQLSITIEPKKGKRYQGLVSLERDSFAKCIEDYFNQSEQLKTRIWLFNNDSKVVGLMLQALPDMLNQDSFDHLVYLAETLTEQESLSIEPQILLTRLFHQESIRDLLVQDVKFHCGCSQKKMLNSVALFPEHELQEILQQKNKITVKCEFCLTSFDFSELDIKSHHAVAGNQTKH